MTMKPKSGEIMRLKAALQAIGKSNEEIAEETGVSERTLSNYIWNDAPVGGVLLRQLHRCYGISVDWLLSGAGVMFVDDREERQARALMPAFEFTDAKNAQDVFIIAAAAIEQSLNQAGAQPGTDYSVLDLYKLAVPFVLERFKESVTDLKFLE